MSTLNISLIQPDLLWEDRSGNRQKLEPLIGALKGKTALVLLPEMFSTGFSVDPAPLAEQMDGETVQWMKRMASETRVVLVGSLIIEEGGQYFNRLIWMRPDGEFGHYDKRHLFAFGGEDAHYAAGQKRFIASVNGWRIQLLICYDLRFPVWARQTRDTKNTGNEPEYDLLIYVANWPARRILAWRTLLQARAIENQCFVAGVNRVGTDGKGLEYPGQSMIVDPMGEVLYLAGDSEEVKTFTLQKTILDEARSKFPFWRDRDQFYIAP